MAVTNTPIFAQTPILGIATLTSPTAITARTNITGTTGLVQLVPAQTNGARIDYISIKAKDNSSVGSLFVWAYNGTTSFLIDEIPIDSAITASTTVPSFYALKSYNNLFLAVTGFTQLYISVSVAQDLNIIAYGGAY